MNSADPTKITALQRDITDHIRVADGAAVQASSRLATLLAQKALGKTIKAKDIVAARKAVADAMEAHDDILLIASALPAMLEDARQEMQVAQRAGNPERIAAEAQAREAYDAAKTALERDWNALGRQGLSSRAASLRALSVKAGCVQAFRDAVESWAGRTHVDVVEQLS